MGLLKEILTKSNKRYELGGLYFRQVAVKELDKLVDFIGDFDTLMYMIKFLENLKSPPEYIVFQIINMERHLQDVVFDFLYELLECKEKKPSRKKFDKMISKIPIDDTISLLEWCFGFHKN